MLTQSSAYLNTELLQSPIRVLLIEDNPGDARLIQEGLRESRAWQFDFKYEDQLSTGLQRLEREPADIVLLDLHLPDGDGLETVTRFSARAGDIPVVVLTGLNDTATAIQAVQAGAQDYLIKGETGTLLLARSIHYALERHRLQQSLRSLSLRDQLTGLYNRRGFMTLAEQQLKIARRTLKSFLLLFADLDDLKRINDTYGHHEGDLALLDMAQILGQNFRESDIIARLGGDEFTILALDATRDVGEILRQHLQEKLDQHNSRSHRPYKLSVSVGLSAFDPTSHCSIEQLVEQADQAMYKNKQDRYMW